MDEENSYDNRFQRVILDETELAYRSEANGELVTFPKLLHVSFNGEEIDTKLSFTTRDGVRIPCIRIDGNRVDLDNPELEIAVDCIIPVG